MTDGFTQLRDAPPRASKDVDPAETQEWLDALSATVNEGGAERGSYLLGGTEDVPGDFVFFQPHLAPGVYARAFLEGRLEEEQLANFRRELSGNGLSSYPHPWLMPNFWQFPTGSMGIGPITSIYQARFMRYLEHRGFIEPSDRRDKNNALLRNFAATVDGQYQTLGANDGASNQAHSSTSIPNYRRSSRARRRTKSTA